MAGPKLDLPYFTQNYYFYRINYEFGGTRINRYTVRFVQPFVKVEKFRI